MAFGHTEWATAALASLEGCQPLLGGPQSGAAGLPQRVGQSLPWRESVESVLSSFAWVTDSQSLEKLYLVWLPPELTLLILDFIYLFIFHGSR